MFSHYSRFMFRREQPAASMQGFGLVELLVSISVMVIVSSIILARQDAFNSAVLLRSQAYEVALQLREVQLNAVSAISDGSGDFRSLIGVYFDTDDAQTYRIFRDVDGDGYDVSEEFGLQGFLDSRFAVVSLIDEAGDDLPGTGLSVVFERPNFDARFFDESGTELDTVNAVQIELQVIASGETRSVEVTRAGQITVLQAP